MSVTMKRPRGFGQWMRLYGLYLRSFPSAERKPISVILDHYRQGRWDIWYCEQDGKFCGLASTMNSPDLVLVDYLAVEPGLRGAGIGSAIVRQLLEKYGETGLFLEVENTQEPAKNHAERIRRKQFYLRNGLEELHVKASLFGVNMELLGKNCQMDYTKYHAFYRDNYSPWAAKHVKRTKLSEEIV